MLCRLTALRCCNCRIDRNYIFCCIIKYCREFFCCECNSVDIKEVNHTCRKCKNNVCHCSFEAFLGKVNNNCFFAVKAAFLENYFMRCAVFINEGEHCIAVFCGSVICFYFNNDCLVFANFHFISYCNCRSCSFCGSYCSGTVFIYCYICTFCRNCFFIENRCRSPDCIKCNVIGYCELVVVKLAVTFCSLSPTEEFIAFSCGIFGKCNCSCLISFLEGCYFAAVERNETAVTVELNRSFGGEKSYVVNLHAAVRTCLRKVESDTFYEGICIPSTMIAEVVVNYLELAGIVCGVERLRNGISVSRFIPRRLCTVTVRRT